MLELLEVEKERDRNSFKIREDFKVAHPEIAKKIESKEYSFLRENEHLGNKICLLGLGGSYAYGTNISSPEHTSDVDCRGIALNTKSEILGTKTFDQFENRETDTVIYSTKKVISLLSACNPNIIEMLGLDKNDYAILSPVGQLLIDNKSLFLSQRAANSFGGYANAQLKRIRSATMRDRLPNLEKQENIAVSMKSAVDTLIAKHELEKYGDITLTVDKDSEQILVNSTFDKLPLGEFVDMMNVLRSVKTDYESSIGNRNQKKDDAHLNKHFMHLCRLYHMGIEILRDHEINTKRTWDHDFLMDIRNGKYMDENGLFVPELYEYVEKLEKDLNYWKENTTLPKSPGYDKIEKLLIKINENSLK